LTIAPRNTGIIKILLSSRLLNHLPLLPISCILLTPNEITGMIRMLINNSWREDPIERNNKTSTMLLPVRVSIPVIAEYKFKIIKLTRMKIQKSFLLAHPL
jgi:hypothetical protein